MGKDRKSMLIVESHMHAKVLENQYFLFKDHFNISFLVNPDKLNIYHSLMPNVMKECKPAYSFHSTTLFLKLIFIAWKYDYIHISTGPEGDHYSSIWNLPLFWLFCFLYRKKTILTVKNIRPYLPSTKGIFSSIRYSALTQLNRFMFETDTMKRIFMKQMNHSFLSASVFDRYVDLLPSHLRKTKSPEAQTQRYVIGLLGSLDSGRRDYDIVISALSSLSVAQSKNLSVCILGHCQGGHRNKILVELQEVLSVDFSENFLTADEFDQKGMSSSILLAPLQRHMEYGTYKGSGAIGDAIYLGKHIILPDFADPDKEFEPISYYYSKVTELAHVFENIATLSAKPIDPSYYSKFTTTNIRETIIKELNLN
jgi:hypothetical protein